LEPLAGEAGGDGGAGGGADAAEGEVGGGPDLASGGAYGEDRQTFPKDSSIPARQI
jgi:hypothetical protein